MQVGFLPISSAMISHSSSLCRLLSLHRQSSSLMRWHLRRFYCSSTSHQKGLSAISNRNSQQSTTPLLRHNIRITWNHQQNALLHTSAPPSFKSAAASDPFQPESHRHHRQNFFTKTEILEIYKSTFKGEDTISFFDFYLLILTSKPKHTATYTGGEVDPQGVFANNELDMSEIDIFGFDYDYTLACYKESLHYLIYDLGREQLINKYQVKKEGRKEGRTFLTVISKWLN